MSLIERVDRYVEEIKSSAGDFSKWMELKNSSIKEENLSFLGAS
jgi:hypothetical protein